MERVQKTVTTPTSPTLTFPPPRHSAYPGSTWSPAMSSSLDLRTVPYYPSSLAQRLRVSVYSRSIPGSWLGSRKPSPQDRSPHLPTRMSDSFRTNDRTPWRVPTPDLRNANIRLRSHLHVSWESDLSLTSATSLLTNYPSSMFMALPIKLFITEPVFDGQLAATYRQEAYLSPHRNQDSRILKDKLPLKVGKT